MIGGTFFEVVYAKGKLDEYKRWLADLGLTHVEISDGTIDIPRERKLELIADFARDFTVLSEVGSKDSAVEFAPYEWVEWMQGGARRRAWKVITEAPRGRHRRDLQPYRRDAHRLIDEIADAVDARRRDLRGADEGLPGLVRQAVRPDVNLGNIPPDEVIPLETLRLGLRGDTLKEVLSWRAAPPALSLQLDFEAMSAEDILRWAYDEFGDQLCLTCSWQKQSSVLVHMVSELGLDDRRRRARHGALLPRDATRPATGWSSATASS